MTLEGQVCMPCNSTLGGRLDLVLARDSWESRLRSQMLASQGGRHGHDRFRERRVEMRYEDEGCFPECRGARFTMDWERCCPRLMDQILVVDETGVRRSFTLEELPRADTRLFRDRPPGSISIVGTDTAACEALRHAAIQIGARFDSDPAPLNVPEVARHGPALMSIEEGSRIGVGSCNPTSLGAGLACLTVRLVSPLSSFADDGLWGSGEEHQPLSIGK
jgi:hypothetical protein